MHSTVGAKIWEEDEPRKFQFSESPGSLNGRNLFNQLPFLQNSLPKSSFTECLASVSEKALLFADSCFVALLSPNSAPTHQTLLCKAPCRDSITLDQRSFQKEFPENWELRMGGFRKGKKHMVVIFFFTYTPPPPPPPSRRIPRPSHSRELDFGPFRVFFRSISVRFGSVLSGTGAIPPPIAL